MEAFNITKNGIGVSKGYAIGTAYVIKEYEGKPTKRTAEKRRNVAEL